MKKFKELLCFLIAFIVLSVLSVVFFVTQLKNADVVGFIGGTEYLKLMLKDPTFFIALFNSYAPPVIISGVLCAVYKIITLTLQKKITLKRNIDYIILFTIGFITPVIYVITLTKGFDFTNNLVFSLQCSLIVTFIYWLIETIIIKFKKENNV